MTFTFTIQFFTNMKHFLLIEFQIDPLAGGADTAKNVILIVVDIW